jgi:hypothetical protein
MEKPLKDDLRFTGHNTFDIIFIARDEIKTGLEYEINP